MTRVALIATPADVSVWTLPVMMDDGSTAMPEHRTTFVFVGVDFSQRSLTGPAFPALVRDTTAVEASADFSPVSANRAMNDKQKPTCGSYQQR
jgi:hypothetical protein